jgi:hypothetical protein
MATNKMAMLLLSCDAYKDLWNDFFNLKDKYWPDCPYTFYIVTENASYDRPGVKVVTCGNDLNWSGRLRYAINSVNSEIISVFLDDYIFESEINTNLIQQHLDYFVNNNVDFFNLGDIFRHVIDCKKSIYIAPHIQRIPKHLKYGIDTSAAIWKKSFLLKLLGTDDYSAWQFEVDRCAEAASEEGLSGNILCDDRMPYNITKIPFVIQGKVYPPCVSYFKKKGYQIETNRPLMTTKEVVRYKIKVHASRIPFGHKILKWIGSKFLGYRFFT